MNRYEEMTSSAQFHWLLLFSCCVVSNFLWPHGLVNRLVSLSLFPGVCLKVKVKVAQSCLTLCDPSGLKPARLLYPWDFPGQNTGVGSLSLLQGTQGFPTQGLNPGLPRCRHILHCLNHQGSPKNTGMGHLIFLQQIFPTQELNWGLLHCRQMLYQPSYQGSPNSRPLSRWCYPAIHPLPSLLLHSIVPSIRGPSSSDSEWRATLRSHRVPSAAPVPGAHVRFGKRTGWRELRARSWPLQSSSCRALGKQPESGGIKMHHHYALLT